MILLVWNTQIGKSERQKADWWLLGAGGGGEWKVCAQQLSDFYLG